MEGGQLLPGAVARLGHEQAGKPPGTGVGGDARCDAEVHFQGGEVAVVDAEDTCTRFEGQVGFLEHLGVFYVPGHGEGLIPILIPRADTAATATMLILIAIAFGVLQVFHGLGVRAWLSLRHGHMTHFWEAVGYLGGLVGLIVFAYDFLSGAGGGALDLIMYAGFAVFLLGIVMSRVILMIAELPTQGGHILSYIRIYAVGVAGAIMANLATDLGFGLAEKLGVIGILIGLVAGLLTHLVILLLTLMGHILQPIRLVWVEFFTKFGFYEESGRPYRPFKSVRNDASSAS